MKCSTPGLPVHHQLLEFTQTHKELLQTPAIYSQKNRPREPKEYRWYTREQQCLLPGNLGDFSILNHSTRFSSSGLPSSYHQSRERSTPGKHLTSVLPALNTQGSKGGRDNRKNKSSGSCPVIDDLLGPSSPSVPSPLLQLSTVWGPVRGPGDYYLFSIYLVLTQTLTNTPLILSMSLYLYTCSLPFLYIKRYSFR